MSEVTLQPPGSGSQGIYDKNATTGTTSTSDTTGVDNKSGGHHKGGGVQDTQEQDTTTVDLKTYGSPDNPSIPQPPKNSTQVEKTSDYSDTSDNTVQTNLENPNTSSTVDANTQAKQTQSNPYLGVNFAAVMSAIMDQVAAMNNQLQYSNAQQELKNRANEVQLALEGATATVNSYNAQSQEQLNNAFADFSNAAIAGSSVIAMGVNSQIATNKGNTETNEAMTTATKNQTAAEGELTTAKTNLKTEQDNQAGMTKAAANPEALEVPSDDEIAAQQAKVDTAQKKVVTAQKNLDDAKAATNNVKQQRLTVIQHAQSHGDQIIKHMSDMATGVINGVKDTNNAALKGLEGSYEAAKQVIQGYQQALREYTENVNDSKKSAQQAVQAGLDAKSKIEDALTRFRSIFG